MSTSSCSVFATKAMNHRFDRIDVVIDLTICACANSTSPRVGPGGVTTYDVAQLRRDRV